MPVVDYQSSDASAPVLTGQAGSLIGVLTACLVSGYGAKAAAGWSLPYTGTNLAAYRMGAGSNEHYLRVDDTGAQEARLVGYETMSAVSVGTGNFPTSAQVSGGMYARKSSTANDTARPWRILANDRAAYIFIYSAETSFGNSAATDSTTFFGQLSGLLTGDAYHTCIVARITSGATNERFGASSSAVSFSATTGHYISRPISQIGSAAPVQKSVIGYNPPTATIGATGGPYLSPTGGINVSPLGIIEGSSGSGSIRGYLPGAWAPLHALPGAHFDTFSGRGALAGKNFVLLNCWSNTGQGRFALETNGNWD